MVTLALAAAVLGTQASAASDSLVIEVFDQTAEVSFVTDRDDAMRAFVRTGTRFAAVELDVPDAYSVRAVQALVDSADPGGTVVVRSAQSQSLSASVYAQDYQLVEVVAAVPAGMPVRVLVDSGVHAGRVFAIQELLLLAGLTQVTVTASARDGL